VRSLEPSDALEMLACLQVKDLNRMMNLGGNKQMVTLQIDSQMVEVTHDLRQFGLRYQSDGRLHIGCMSRNERKTYG
jgi:hypothetical protein